MEGFKTLKLVDRKTQPEHAEKRLIRQQSGAVFYGKINRFAFFIN